MIGIDNARQAAGTLIRRGTLISRHTTEGSARPSGQFASLLPVLTNLLPHAASGTGVMTVQYATLYVGWIEVSKRN